MEDKVSYIDENDNLKPCPWRVTPTRFHEEVWDERMYDS